MSTAALYELIGYVGSALVVISLTMRSLLRLRVINLAGAAVFGVYGVLISAPPVWIVNGVIVLIDLWHLRGMLGTNEQLEVLEVAPGNSYLARFLERYRDDIAALIPSFEGIDRSRDRAFFVLRDLVPAALVVLREPVRGEAVVELDYAPPAYRDHTSGRFVYGDAELFADLGARRVVAATGHPKHDAYLERMGFQRADGAYVLEVG